MNGEKSRNIDVYSQFRAMLRAAPRSLSFNKDTRKDFYSWKAAFKKKIEELLGRFPKPVPLNPAVVEEIYIDDFEDIGIPPFIQKKILYDTDKYSSCMAYLLLPANLNDKEKRPAILNAHGHGMGNKKLIGLDPGTWGIEGPNYEASAIHLVKEGFIVLAPDWRPFGERRLRPDYQRRGRDPCNITHMSFKYFDYNLLSLNISDAMRSVDYLSSIPQVDTRKIGMVGKSYGGTMTAYTAALDERISVAAISGYLSTLDDAMSDRGLGNYCGAQFLPGLLNWGDIPDVIGLIAPRPLLIEAGERDECFVFQDTTKAYELLSEIYEAAGSLNMLQRDVAKVGHEYIFNKLPCFLSKYLKN